MKITPLAFDSLGTRSMATFVETKGLSVLIDPGVNLGPNRFNLPPHPIELERREAHWEKIKSHAKEADILIVTHYHFDHINPEALEIYQDKIVLLKHPTEKINLNQRLRAAELLVKMQEIAREVHFADGRAFSYAGIEIHFSPAVSHGAFLRHVFTIQVSLREGDFTFLHTSDVMGAESEEHITFILKENPDVLILDGPNYNAKHEGLDNGKRVLEETKVKTLLLDHHLLRDLRWREVVGDLFQLAEARGVRLTHAAGFLGVEEDLLEAKRRELYEKYPVKTQLPLWK